MKAVLIWAGLCSALLLAALLMRQLPPVFKGFGIMIMLILVHGGLICRIWRAHK